MAHNLDRGAAAGGSYVRKQHSAKSGVYTEAGTIHPSVPGRCVPRWSVALENLDPMLFAHNDPLANFLRSTTKFIDRA